MPLVIGYGRMQLNRFYYNSDLRTCLPFIYMGEGGNQNNFRTMQNCAKHCMNSPNPLPPMPSNLSKSMKMFFEI